MPKRVIATIKQVDYTSKEEYEKDVPKMRAKGYTVVSNDCMMGKVLTTQDIVGDDKWKFTAYFIKDTM